MTSPYLVPGPCLIGFSGGRTSGYLLHQLLTAHNGRLPRDHHVIFADTGREHPGTHVFVRECAERWGVEIIVVRAPSPPDRPDMIPFEALIKRKRYLPNPGAAFCSNSLKVEPSVAFMRSWGYGDDFTDVVGLRADERHRVGDLLALHTPYSHAFPLVQAGVSRADVLAFWRSQPFDLNIPRGLGNCDLCWKKGVALRVDIITRFPETPLWWSRMERESGHTFRKPKESPPYERLARFARDQGRMFKPEEPEDVGETVGCGCTDRRVIRPRTCTCDRRTRRARRGEGHALSCAHVFGREGGERLFDMPAPMGAQTSDNHHA